MNDRFCALALPIVVAAASAQQALAQGDLLVAPTRLVMSGPSAGEVVVSNSGSQPSTYRISLALRRMDENGQINTIEEAQATPAEAAALAMINYAPRKITLGPRQSQTIRVGIRPPADLQPGEYRAHLLFRAVPDAVEPVAKPDAPAEGMTIQLTPIYGVAIPIIIRAGELAGTASIISAKLEKQNGISGISVTLGRAGNRSVYGTVELMAAGRPQPVATMKGIAVYPEVTQRQLFVSLDNVGVAAARSGMTVRFTETDPAGKRAVAEAPVHWKEAAR